MLNRIVIPVGYRAKYCFVKKSIKKAEGCPLLCKKVFMGYWWAFNFSFCFLSCEAIVCRATSVLSSKVFEVLLT